MGTQPPSRSSGGEPGVHAIKRAALKYTGKIRQFAHLPDGRGANHQSLVAYFGKLDERWSRSPDLPVDEQRFALSYTFEKDTEGDPSTPKWILNKPVEYETCVDFVLKTKSEPSKSSSRLLFLTGAPSPEWLGIIGTKYRIDPEFFVRFLHFTFAENPALNYSLPALPAATWNILEIPVITTGRRKVVPGPPDQTLIDAMRSESRVKLQAHHNRLQEDKDIEVATSIVRDIAIIDQGYFALEQRLWICLQPNLLQKDSKDPQWSLVIWTDAGRMPGVQSILDLDILPKEFQMGATSLLPVVDYKPSMGLAADRYKSDGLETPVNGAESASQLCIGYGRTLHDHTMATDPLYALTEAFNIATASMNQYLNVIQHKLAGFTDYKNHDDLDALANLRYIKNILYQLQRQLAQVECWLEPRQSYDPSGWRTTGSDDAKATQTFQAVVHRYKYLQTRAQTLQDHCKDDISNLMNIIASGEAKSSYEQAKRISKLTFLAFSFAPLSFTTSFFAMNIGLSNLGLGTWFIVTVVLLTTTIVVMLVDFSVWIRRIRRGFHHLARKAQYI